jgi:hypothetical protein
MKNIGNAINPTKFGQSNAAESILQAAGGKDLTKLASAIGVMSPVNKLGPGIRLDRTGTL